MYLKINGDLIDIVSMSDKSHRMKIPLNSIEMDGDSTISLNVSSVSKVNRKTYAMVHAPTPNVVKQSTVSVKTVYIELQLLGNVTSSTPLPPV